MPAITPKQALQNPEVLKAVESHLKDPLKPLPDEQLAGIKDLVECPLKNTKQRGGLTPPAEAAAKELNLKSLLQLSDQHRELAKKNIKAVIGTAYFFAKSKQEKLNPEEQAALRSGIVSKSESGVINHIQTVKKGGRLLTDEFKVMMAALYGPLKRNHAQETQILESAAAYQRQAEIQDKKMTAPALEMA